MKKGCIIRPHPHKQQEVQPEKSFDASRFVYNLMIEIGKKRYKRGGKSLSAYDMHKYLPKIKKQHCFLSEVCSQSLQIACSNLSDAYKKFFQKRAGYPNFKKKNLSQSFTTINDSRIKISPIRKNKIQIPKVGLLNFRSGKLPEGKIKYITIKRIAGKYYASILIDDDKAEPKPKNFDKLTGIDLGLKSFAVVSNGGVIPNPKNFQKAQKELCRKQKALSRKVKGSKKHAQTKLQVGRLHQKIQNQRKDFHHKITKSLVANDENQAFAIEDLNVRGMVKNRRLAKHISDAGWSQFKSFLKYKSADVGKQVFEVGRFFASSKTCSSCGVVNGDLKLTDRDWTCSSCKAEHDRDFNASLNIALEAARNVAGGDALRLERLRSGILSGVCEAENVIYSNSVFN